MESVKRIEKWDILKLFLMFCVVLGHLIQNFGEDSDLMDAEFFLIYSFHMPLFIFISGLFSKKTVNEKRYDKIAVYLFLFIITKIILFVSRWAAYGELSFNLFDNGGLPWYMLALFAFMLITIALRKISPAYVLLLSVALACVMGYDTQIGDLLAINRIIVYYPFFYLGYCLDRSAVEKFTDKKYIKIISAVLIIAYIVVVVKNIEDIDVFKCILTGRREYSALEKYERFGPLLRLAYYPLTAIICTAIISLTPKKLGRKGVIAKLGSRSIQVYILHYTFVHFIDGRLSDYIPSTHQTAVFSLAALLITVFLSLKIWEPIFRLLMNPFRKKEK